MRTRSVRTMVLLLTLLILAEPTRVSAQVEPRPSAQLPFAAATDSLYPHPARAALDVGWREPPADVRSASKGSWAVVGFLGSVAGAWAGAHAGARLGLFDDPSSEDPELPSVVFGAVVGSAFGAASIVAAVDGRDGSFSGALGGTVVGTIVGLIAAGALDDSAGLVAFSLAQALGAVVGVTLTD